MVCCFTGSTSVHPMDIGEVEKGLPVTQSESTDNPSKKDRSCRDVIFVLLFAGALGAMFFFAAVGVQKGDPYRMIYGVDSFGNTCNRKNTKIDGAPRSGENMVSKTKSFFFDPLKLHSPEETTVICVSECNKENVNNVKSYYDRTNIKLCEYDVHHSHIETSERHRCAPIPYPKSTSILNRCVPNMMMEAIMASAGSANGIMNAIDSDFLSKFVSDITNTWVEILYLQGIAFGGAFLFCLGFSWIAAPMIWMTYILLLAGTGGGIGYMWYKQYQNERMQPPLTDDYMQKWLIASAVVSIIGGIIILILIFMRTRIKLVAELFKESGKALRCMPNMLFQPVVTTLFLALAMVGMAALYIFMATAEDATVNYDTGRVTWKLDAMIQYARWYHLFMFLWIIQFILACQELIIASSVSTWFFTRDKRRLGSPILKGYYRLIRYHLGTVAFGSLIIAIVQMVRIILAYIQRKLKGRAGKAVDFLLKCLSLFMWCLEKFLKYINRNAYIECAIHNHSFCGGARAAVQILVANAMRVAAINSIGDFILFLGKLAISAGTVACGLFFFVNAEDVNYTWAPLLLAGIGAYFIASCFFGIYEMTIDTLFICFCEDMSMNDGTTKPYYMSKGLMQLVDGYEKAKTGNKKPAKPEKPEQSD